ncbi:MAG: smalltalk protein [Bacteroidaceae bacterium]|nr:smalltalk protein [Bacteroidaceae bacterium]
MSKKETWKFILQTLAAIISAILTSLGVTSCMMNL